MLQSPKSKRNDPALTKCEPRRLNNQTQPTPLHLHYSGRCSSCLSHGLCISRSRTSGHVLTATCRKFFFVRFRGSVVNLALLGSHRTFLRSPRHAPASRLQGLVLSAAMVSAEDVSGVTRSARCVRHSTYSLNTVDGMHNSVANPSFFVLFLASNSNFKNSPKLSV